MFNLQSSRGVLRFRFSTYFSIFKIEDNFKVLRKYVPIVGALVGLLGWSPSVFAKTLLSFNQCVDLVQKNNVEIRSAAESLQGSQFQIDSYRGSYYPQISGSLSFSQSGPPSAIGGLTNGSTYGAILSATQNVFNGNADVAKVDQFIAQSNIAESILQTTKAKVSFDLKSAFANLIFAKESEQSAKDFQKRREENYRMVELRFQSGRENKGSLLLAQAYLKQATVDVLKARYSRESSQVDLKTVLGFEGSDIAAEGDLDILEEIPMREPSEQNPDFHSMAFMTPDRRQSMAQVKVAEALLTGAKAGFLPNLNLTGSLGKLDTTFFPNQDRWSLGANLSWSLLGGGKDYYNVKSSVANLYSAKSKLSNVERQLISSLKKSYIGYVEAVEDYKVNEAFLKAAKSRAEIAHAKYNNGLLTFDEWDIIENDLIAKTKSYIQSKRDRLIAEASWEQAQGLGVIP